MVNDVEEEWKKGRLDTLGDVGSFMASELRRRPVGVAELVALKAARSWYATDSHRNERLSLGVQLLYLTLIAYSGVRAYRAGRRDEADGRA